MGLQYAYSAWAPQFASRMKISSTESNFIVSYPVSLGKADMSRYSLFAGRCWQFGNVCIGSPIGIVNGLSRSAAHDLSGCYSPRYRLLSYIFRFVYIHQRYLVLALTLFDDFKPTNMEKARLGLPCCPSSRSLLGWEVAPLSPPQSRQVRRPCTLRYIYFRTNIRGIQPLRISPITEEQRLLFL
jgi:hypothetical protein